MNKKETAKSEILYSVFIVTSQLKDLAGPRVTANGVEYLKGSQSVFSA
jgi:hypothetical protein